MRSLKRATAMLLPLALVSITACLESRERLDAPRVRMQLEGNAVTAGTDLRGVISAADASGIIYVSASLVIGGDVDTRRSDRIDLMNADTIDFAFFLPVESSAPRGAQVIVTATVIDNQLFTVTAEDTVYVR